MEKSSGREYAVKIIDLTGEEDNEAQMDEFRLATKKEMNILRMCAQHPHISMYASEDIETLALSISYVQFSCSTCLGEYSPLALASQLGLWGSKGFSKLSQFEVQYHTFPQYLLKSKMGAVTVLCCLSCDGMDCSRPVPYRSDSCAYRPLIRPSILFGINLGTNAPG